MGDRYLLDLATVCRRTGYRVIEVDSASTEGDGWKYRARGSGGYNSGKPNHVMAHHTASSPSSDGWPGVNYCTFTDEDAPLCNLYLSRKAEIYVCAGGATNTNGSGTDPCGIVDQDSMNSSAIGIEAANDGVGEIWPAEMQRAYNLLCKELCEAYGIPFRQIHSHWEYAPSRKVDPAGPALYQEPPRLGPSNLSWNMDSFRQACESAGGSTPVPPEPTPEPDYKWIEVDVQLPEIKQGDSNEYVCRMQHLLAAAGFMEESNVKNYDGVWGSGTEKAKVAFDIEHGLTPSPPSDCGARSWESLLTGKRW